MDYIHLATCGTVIILLLCSGTSKPLNFSVRQSHRCIDCLKQASVEIKLEPTTAIKAHLYTNKTGLIDFYCTAKTPIASHNIRQFKAVHNNISVRVCDLNQTRCKQELTGSSQSVLGWRFSIGLGKYGHQTVSCSVEVKDKHDNSSRTLHSENVTFDLYQLPTKVTILPKEMALQTQIDHEISCKAEDGWPVFLVLLFLNSNNEILREAVGSEIATLKLQLMKHHRKSYFKCVAKDHRKRPVLTVTSKPVDILFLERNNQTVDKIMVYRQYKNGVNLKCSDYIDWSGNITFTWFGIPIQSLPKRFTDEYELR